MVVYIPNSFPNFPKTMKILILSLGLLTWIGGCSKEEESLDTPVIETDAVWQNMLAVDGCGWHFSIVKPDTSFALASAEASLPKIEKEIGKMEGAYSTTNVHLKYRLTGKKKPVQCGWGHTAHYDEVEVLEIHKR